VSLWFGLFAGPLAWTAHELLSYVLVRPACTASVLFLEYLVTIAALAVTGAGLYVAAPRTELRPPQTTTEFISLTSIVLNVLFAFAILMEAIPNVVVSPCL
jgi:hypothetical protein